MLEANSGKNREVLTKLYGIKIIPYSLIGNDNKYKYRLSGNQNNMLMAMKAINKLNFIKEVKYEKEIKIVSELTDYIKENTDTNIYIDDQGKITIYGIEEEVQKAFLILDSYSVNKLSMLTPYIHNRVKNQLTFTWLAIECALDSAYPALSAASVCVTSSVA